MINVLGVMYYPSSLSLLRFGLGLLLETLISYLLLLGLALTSNSPLCPLKEHIKNAWACLLPRKHQTSKKHPGRMGPRMLHSPGYPNNLYRRETVRPGAIQSWWGLRISRAGDMVGTGEMPSSIWVCLGSLPSSLELIQFCRVGRGKNLYFLQTQFSIPVMCP